MSLNTNFNTSMTNSFESSQQTFATTNATPWAINIANRSAAQNTLAGGVFASQVIFNNLQSTATQTFSNSNITAGFNRDATQLNNTTA